MVFENKAYADRLLKGLDTVDWSEAIKDQQRNWIGSPRASVSFDVEGHDVRLKCSPHVLIPFLEFLLH